MELPPPPFSPQLYHYYKIYVLSHRYIMFTAILCFTSETTICQILVERDILAAIIFFLSDLVPAFMKQDASEFFAQKSIYEEIKYREDENGGQRCNISKDR